ncbi:iron ABC transporter permease [Maricaulis sp.]|jgi:iron complex transport system permease protein|uniref:FecCD family ABC transporter permease n=1 Tax=Maricaulis sp. TaxID=1486257 RepID=UPI0025E89C8E|nr:iron ABC transporter permease [Maricaulis sp.]MDF1768123.1 iron ABC transporter permease [Maricaulis sp.]
MTPLRLNLLLAVILTLVSAIALFAGSGGAGPAALIAPDDELGSLVLRELRLPRVLLGILVGAGLGAAGAALQGFFRNPLADPGIVGVSASAGLGAVICLYFGLSSLFALALPVAGVIGAAFGVLALFAIAGRGASATTLILAGVAVNATAGAVTALLMNLAPNPWALAEIAYWLMGSLGDASWTEVGFAAPVILTGLIVLVPLARGLDALGLGEETARSLGIGLGRLKLAVVLGTALAVGGGVAVAGAIGFVGLVVPHVLRPLVAWRAGALILPSALGGAVLIILADLATRLLSGPGIPLYLGVLTALIGAPFFLWLVRHTQRRAP